MSVLCSVFSPPQRRLSSGERLPLHRRLGMSRLSGTQAGMQRNPTLGCQLGQVQHTDLLLYVSFLDFDFSK